MGVLKKRKNLDVALRCNARTLVSFSLGVCVGLRRAHMHDLSHRRRMVNLLEFKEFFSSFLERHGASWCLELRMDGMEWMILEYGFVWLGWLDGWMGWASFFCSVLFYTVPDSPVIACISIWTVGILTGSSVANPLQESAGLIWL